MSYSARLVDAELDELLPHLPAVVIEGPKGVGKTATASRRSQRIYALDDPATRALFEAGAVSFGPGDGTLLLDEWQRLPEVWDLVRRAVDAGAHPGSFLLAGSAVPVEAPTHSGAGRIVSVRMRPLSLAERALAEPTVSLAGLLSGNRPAVDGETSVGLSTYVEEILGSGFPGIRAAKGRARRAQLDGYLDRAVERDFAEQGVRLRRPTALRNWLAAYAAATATTTSYNAILDAATPGEHEKPAKTTTIVYREVLSQLWLLDPVPGWTPGGTALGRLGSAPKHHLADPALAARLLGLDASSLLDNSDRSARSDSGLLLGALFESLVTQSVRTYAQFAEARVFHFRTRNGDHEVDLVVERADGSVVAIEVKLARSPDDRSVRHLRWLRDRIGDRVLDMVVITAGERAYRRSDGVAVVPAALLGG